MGIAWERDLIAVDSTGPDGAPSYEIIDADTGETVERLTDQRFDWKQKKREALQMARVCATRADQSPVMAKKAEKLRGCATWLQYRYSSAKQAQELHRANLCADRLCPVCATRRAHGIALRMTKVLDRAMADEGGQYLFITLTIPNVMGPDLRAALDLLTASFVRLTKRKKVARAVIGWFRALEITYNKQDGTYHPHIHAIAHVRDEYFDPASGLYINFEALKALWAASVRMDPDRVGVHIQATRDKAGRLTRGGKTAAAAAAEAAKYAVKSADYMDPALLPDQQAEIIECYAEALHGKRLIGLFGSIKAAAAALQLDAIEDVDLMRDDDASARVTLAEADILRSYCWHWKMCEHLHAFDEPNPDYCPTCAQALAAAAAAGACQGRPGGPGQSPLPLTGEEPPQNGGPGLP